MMWRLTLQNIFILLIGILSHNTITVAAYLLWCAFFNRDYTIGILANKADKSREILSRIKLMYEELPFWLKPRNKKVE